MDYHAGFMLAESMNPCPYAFHNHSCSLASERGKPKPDSWADTNINLTVRPGKISCNIIFLVINFINLILISIVK
jgi:hypothetical protein